MADEPIDLTLQRQRMADMEAQRRQGDNGGFGALLFTVYHYEDGHIVSVPDERLPPDYHEIWRRMYTTLWRATGKAFEETGDPDDEVIFMSAIATNGRVVSYSDDKRLNNLERQQWVRKMLERIGKEDLPAKYKCYHDNDNHQETTP